MSCVPYPSWANMSLPGEIASRLVNAGYPQEKAEILGDALYEIFLEKSREEETNYEYLCRLLNLIPVGAVELAVMHIVNLGRVGSVELTAMHRVTRGRAGAAELTVVHRDTRSRVGAVELAVLIQN